MILGNASGAGEENRNVARMAWLLAGFPDTVPGITVNRLCTSGLSAITMASHVIEAGTADVVVAGGVESTSRAPGSWRSRAGASRSPETAEAVAIVGSISREDAGAFAVASHEWAITTDVASVAETAKIGSPFAALGATLDSGGHALFAERLGAHRTLDLVYTAELMSGTEAVRAGLFSRSVPAEELLRLARVEAAAVAEGATGGLASRELAARIRDERLGLWESVENENRVQGGLCRSEDYAEGFAAFQQKRTPRFTGRTAAAERG